MTDFKQGSRGGLPQAPRNKGGFYWQDAPIRQTKDRRQLPAAKLKLMRLEEGIGHRVTKSQRKILRKPGAF